MASPHGSGGSLGSWPPRSTPKVRCPRGPQCSILPMITLTMINRHLETPSGKRPLWRSALRPLRKEHHIGRVRAGRNDLPVQAVGDIDEPVDLRAAAERGRRRKMKENRPDKVLA